MTSFACRVPQRGLWIILLALPVFLAGCPTGPVPGGGGGGGGDPDRPPPEDSFCGQRGRSCCNGSRCDSGLVCLGDTCTDNSSCGQEGRSCCPGGSCSHGTCIPGTNKCEKRSGCGERGDRCCDGARCEAGLVCYQSRTCEPTTSVDCGGRDDSCCPGDLPGEECASGLECQDNRCVPADVAGEAGQPCREGVAENLRCGDGLVCVGGLCREEEGACGSRGQACCDSGPQCPGSGNLDCCSGTCVDLARDDSHCGQCDRTCSSGQRCESSSCRTPTTSSTVCGAENQVCCNSGDICDSSDLVCQDNRCVRRNQGGGTCDIAGEACSSSSACCGSLACRTIGYLGIEKCCSEVHSGCTSDLDCCGFMQCSSDGRCMCRTANQTCREDSDCCSGLVCGGNGLCVTTDGDPCANASNSCGGCTGAASGQCGWCASSNRCMIGQQSGPTRGSCDSRDWKWYQGECDCTATSCGSCADDSNCGWCDNRCVSMSRFGSCYGSVATSSYQCGGGGTAPSGWTCPTIHYGSRDGCDCNCGVRDPDCDVSGQRLWGCSSGETCNSYGQCSTSAVPNSWHCRQDYYNARDGCDCNCGAYDPDCSITGQQVLNCGGQACTLSGTCAGTSSSTSVPPGWVGCPDSWYGEGIDCDCNCGAYDPDCNDLSLDTPACGDYQVCVAPGVCIDDDYDYDF